jgi:hypothetical protein
MLVIGGCVFAAMGLYAPGNIIVQAMQILSILIKLSLMILIYDA